MRLLALTVSHHEASLDELARVSVPPGSLADALPCLVRAPDVREAVVLSTCNRTEIYAWVDEPQAAADQIALFLEDLRDLPAGWVRDRCRILQSDDVIRHAFTVAAGLDSMVRGESEIQGQVRNAYKTAASLGAVGPHLHGLFRWALEAGKRARSETGLSRTKYSFPRAAVHAIDASLGGLAGKEVLIVGNGKMACSSLRALAPTGARARVTARRIEAARELAARFDAWSLRLDQMPDALVTADAAVFATSSPEPMIRFDQMAAILEARTVHPLVLIDLGLPRNVAPEVAALDGDGRRLDLYDLARLDDESFTTPGELEALLGTASEITTREAERCVAWFRSKPADAVVAAIQAQAAALAEMEVHHAMRRIQGLDDRQRAEVERAIRRTVRKLVHLPTVRTKEAAARGDESLLQAARWLFGITGDGSEPVVDRGWTAHRSGPGKP